MDGTGQNGSEYEAGGNVTSELVCADFSKADEDALAALSFWAEGVVQTSVAVLGVAANAASALVLTRQAMRNAFNLMLVTLAAFDSW